MNTKLDVKRIVIFLAFAFGIAWLTGLVIYFTGGLTDSPQLAPNLTLALILLATAYMWAPAIANILTRVITREGWSNTGLRPNIRRGWPLWLAAWLLPGLLTIMGGVIFFLIFPQYYDPTLSFVTELLESVGQAGTISPWMVVISQTLNALLLAPIINSLFTFGEEFGWRGYLLQKLMPLGGRRASVLMGIIWGIWHWPVIFMGYEYGFDYPGYPVLGPLVFLWFTFVGGTMLNWLALRGGSVWPAVIGHASINGMAGLMIFFQQGTPNPLLGPLPVGIIGAMGFALLCLVLFLKDKALAPNPIWNTTPRQVEQAAVVDSVEAVQ